MRTITTGMRVLGAWLLLYSVALAQDQALPGEIAPLAQLMTHEDQAIEVLRRFDRAQNALGDWDFELARQLGNAGDTAAAQTKLDDARRRFDLVRKAYETFLQTYPNNARALTYFGELLYDRYQEYPQAIQNWKLATQLDATLGMPCNDLGIHYCHEGDYDQGFSYFEKALELEPNNPDYLFNVAQIYLTNRPQAMERYKWNEKRLFKEAMKLSKRATELAPNDFSLAQDYAVNFFAAESLGISANWNEAIKAWEHARALTTNPDQIYYAWLNEGRAAIKANKASHASACLEEAIRMNPNSTAARGLLEEVKHAQQAGL